MFTEKNPTILDDCYLITLEDFIGFTSLIASNGDTAVLTRPTLPQGGLEMLNELVPKNLSLHASSSSFMSTFDRITGNLLYGLDWSNVLVAGGMVLTTLLHTDSSQDHRPSILQPDLDIYLYGLNAQEANAKVLEIEDIWQRNLPSHNKQRRVTKTAKPIELLADYPVRRVQIILKLLRNPTRVLLNFDLDACALGFNGSDVVMLPRCARALETGHTVFTMDLVWGHHLGRRRETRLQRIFKYANRGFGVRILPSYVRSLQSSIPEIVGSDEEEPGLKTLRRLFYEAKVFVRRRFFGPRLRGADSNHWFHWHLESDFSSDYLTDPHETIPSRPSRAIPLWALMGEDHDVVPGPVRSKGLRNFQIFARCCEVWELAARGQAVIHTQPQGLGYDEIRAGESIYMIGATYIWNETFNPRLLTLKIDALNARLQDVFTQNVRESPDGLVDKQKFERGPILPVYMQVHGHSVQEVQTQNIMLPVWVPLDLEQGVRDLVQWVCRGETQVLEIPPVLIPVYRVSKALAGTDDPRSLLDGTNAEDPKLRLWTIDSSMMWAGQSRVFDEIIELMWVLFYLLHCGMSPHSNKDLDANLTVARAYRRRIVLPEITDDEASHGERADLGLPTLRESILFRQWVLATPNDPHGSGNQDTDPSPEHLYWPPDEEGVERTATDNVFGVSRVSTV